MLSGDSHSFVVPNEHVSRHKKLLYIQTVIDSRPKLLPLPEADINTQSATRVKVLNQASDLKTEFLLRYGAILIAGLIIGYLCHQFI